MIYLFMNTFFAAYDRSNNNSINPKQLACVVVAAFFSKA